MGRIFVANEFQFEGYTDGGGKEVVGGMMRTGDVGRLDSAGRLSVEGRDDEMIVSGGRERVPTRGRGPARRSRRHRRGRGRWGLRTSSSASA